MNPLELWLSECSSASVRSSSDYGKSKMDIKWPRHGRISIEIFKTYSQRINPSLRLLISSTVFLNGSAMI